jgi:hypothetical protein
MSVINAKPETVTFNGENYTRSDLIPAPQAVTKERKGAWVIGEKYLIRTVTMIDIGILVHVDDHELVLSQASWIADTNRFATALETGNLKEVEPFPDEAIVGRGAIVDASVWSHDLPRTQK